MLRLAKFYRRCTSKAFLQVRRSNASDSSRGAAFDPKRQRCRPKPASFSRMKKQPARKTAKTTKAKDGAAPKKQHITTEDRHKAFAREYVALAFNAPQVAISLAPTLAGLCPATD